MHGRALSAPRRSCSVSMGTRAGQRRAIWAFRATAGLLIASGAHAWPYESVLPWYSPVPYDRPFDNPAEHRLPVIPQIGIVDGPELADFWRAARERRVDIIGIGDSNQLHFTGGWDQGFHVALAERFPVYATPLFGVYEFVGGAQGYLSSFTTLPSNPPIDDDLPATYRTRWDFFPNVIPGRYFWLAPGSSFTPQLLGVGIAANSPIDVTGPLRFHFWYATSDQPGGGFTPAFRHNGPNYGGVIDAPPVSTFQPGSPEYRVATLDVPAGPRAASAVYGGFTRPGGQPMTGPLFGTFARAENLDCAAGVAYSSLVFDGGRSLRSMASRILGMTIEQRRYYLRALVRLQPADRPMLLVCMNSGVNDRNESLPSLGPAALEPGNSPQAFADNALALIRALREAWFLAGFDPDDLFFLIAVTPPISDPEDERLIEYRRAAAILALSEPRTACADLAALTNYHEMLARGWYFGPPVDTVHLWITGYENLARRQLTAFIGPLVQGDANSDGSVTLADFFLILSRWGQPSPPHLDGDLDGDGLVTLADLSEVLSHFPANE